jgi:SET domain
MKSNPFLSADPSLKLSIENTGGELVSEKLFLKELGAIGKGVFAKEKYLKGEIVVTFDGPAMNYLEITDENRTIQISSDLFRGPSGKFDDYVNHSCEPNCGLVVNGEQMDVIAIRDIAEGEEITFDYSTDTNLDDGWLMDCCCGSSICRGKIGDFSDLPLELQQKYIALGIVPDFILKAKKAQK